MDTLHCVDGESSAGGVTELPRCDRENSIGCQVQLPNVSLVGLKCCVLLQVRAVERSYMALWMQAS